MQWGRTTVPRKELAGERGRVCTHRPVCPSRQRGYISGNSRKEGQNPQLGPAAGLRAAGPVARCWGTFCRNQGLQEGKGFASLTENWGKPKAKGQCRSGKAWKQCGGGGPTPWVDLQQRQTGTLSFLGVQGTRKGKRTTVFKDKQQRFREAIGQVGSLPLSVHALILVSTQQRRKRP